MQSFNEYLTEEPLFEAAGKRTHLTHLEDVVLDDGPSGVDFAIKTLREFSKILNGGSVSKGLNVSVKWDGAPALVFGHDPADGKFFVATKGAFSKTPTLAKNHGDIDKLYPGGLAPKMHVAFDVLKGTKPSAIVQGDMLFTSSMLGQQTIDGKTYVTFQPNTILYAVDVESDLGKRIAGAEFGIVAHTMYTGSKDITTYSAGAISSGVFSSIQQSKNLVLLDAGYDDVSGTVTFTSEEKGDFLLALDAAQNAAKSVNARLYDSILQEPLHGYIAQFVNNTVKQGAPVTPASVPGELTLFIDAIKQREIAARKTPAGKESIAQSFDKYLTVVRQNSSAFVKLFACHAALTRAKNLVVRKLGQAARVASFVPTGDGFKVTGPEGFVAVARDGKAVKLVDRLEFSRLNFTQPKNWQ